MKTVLITGAAQGIGLATAKRYAAQGWFIGIYDINRKGIDALLASGEFPNACGGHCDVTNHSSICDMFEDFANKTNNRLDLLINNAGVLSAGRFEDIDQRSHALMIDVNIAGATHTLQQAFPLLSQTPGATVVNLCSASSIHGLPRLAVYSATKFYVDGLTEALDLEWREHDIRVTCVKPPVINTAMGQSVAQELPQKLSISLDPADVAELIQTAAEGSATSYTLGAASKLWYWLDKLLPNFLRHPLCRYISGVEQAT